MPKYKQGDTITWRARYASDPENTGTVLAIVPTGSSVAEALNLAARAYDKSQIKSGLGSFDGRSDTWPLAGDRYLIEVKRPKGKPLYYFPKISKIDAQKGDS